MTVARRMRSDDDWQALRHEVLEKFTPSAPVTTRDLFAGRAPQLIQCMDVIAERGRHGIIYGEPGVGKTSISQVAILATITARPMASAGRLSPRGPLGIGSLDVENVNPAIFRPG